MGYITSTTITAYDPGSKEGRPLTVDEHARLASCSGGASYCLGEAPGDEQSGTWYDQTEDLSRLSATFPAVTYVMDVYDEEGERWQTYAHGGRAVDVEPILTWPAPDYASADAKTGEPIPAPVPDVDEDDGDTGGGDAPVRPPRRV